MPHPLVKNRKTYRGEGIYCGRPSQFGNPWVIGVHGDREWCIAKYEQWFLSRSEQWKKEAKEILRGKTLICWCAPLHCHCDFLATWVNK